MTLSKSRKSGCLKLLLLLSPNKVWHYHELGCGKVFRLAEPIKRGQPCPKCGEPFAKIIKFDCGGCKTIYYKDVSYPVGHELDCPINGEPIIVTRSGGFDNPTKSKKSISWIYVVVIFIAPVIYYALLQLTSRVFDILGFIRAIVATVITVMVDFVTLLGWGAAGVGAFVIICLLLWTLVIKPANYFSEIYRAAHKRDPTNYLIDLYHLPQGYPDYMVLRETVNRSRDTVVRQQLIIGVLIIGLSIGALICYLSVQTLEEARQLLQKTIQLGVVNIIGFAILFYGLKFLVGIDKRLAQKGGLIKGVVLSALFGGATLLTLIVLPSFWGESLLTGSIIAIELTINIIGDVLILSYQTITNLYLRKLG